MRGKSVVIIANRMKRAIMAFMVIMLCGVFIKAWPLDWGASIRININPQGDWIPERVTDLSAQSAANEGQIDLNWTAPRRHVSLPDGSVSGYYIRYATYSVTELGGDTTAWWDLASEYERTFANDASQSESDVLNLGPPGTTYYFAIMAYNEAVPTALSSLIDKRAETANQAKAMSADIIPETPAGFVAITQSTTAISLSWSNMSAGTGYLDFAYYSLERSSASNGNYIEITTTTLTSYVDELLEAGVTYYYRLSAYDAGPMILQSAKALANAVVARPKPEIEPPEDTIIPNPPYAIRVDIEDRIKLSWKSPKENEDGTKYEDKQGFNIYRSNQIFSGWSNIGFVADSGNEGRYEWYENIPNNAYEVYYYYVKALDANNNESNQSAICDSRENIIALSTSDNNIVGTIPSSIREVLYKGTKYDEDIEIEVAKFEDSSIPNVLGMYEFTAVKAESKEAIKDFSFDKTAMKLGFMYLNVIGSIKRAGITAENIDTNDLSLFWYNGVEWIKISSFVEENMIQTRTSRLGKYMLKLSIRPSSFVINKVYPKIFSPNNDGRNDFVEIHYENPLDANPVGRIYDMNGAVVAEMHKGPNYNTLIWDGKKKDGNVAEPGAYIYQVEVTGPESKTFNGVVILAR